MLQRPQRPGPRSLDAVARCKGLGTPEDLLRVGAQAVQLVGPPVDQRRQWATCRGEQYAVSQSRLSCACAHDVSTALPLNFTAVSCSGHRCRSKACLRHTSALQGLPSFMGNSWSAGRQIYSAAYPLAAWHEAASKHHSR